MPRSASEICSIFSEFNAFSALDEKRRTGTEAPFVTTPRSDTFLSQSRSPRLSRAGTSAESSIAGSPGGGHFRLPEQPLLEIAQLRAPQYFGELALLEAKKRATKKATHSASVVTTSRVELLVLSRCLLRLSASLITSSSELLVQDQVLERLTSTLTSTRKRQIPSVSDGL